MLNGVCVLLLRELPIIFPLEIKGSDPNMRPLSGCNKMIIEFDDRPRPLPSQLHSPIHANCQSLVMDYSGITYIYHFLHVEDDRRRKEMITPQIIIFLSISLFSFLFSAVFWAPLVCAVIVYAHFPSRLQIKRKFSIQPFIHFFSFFPRPSHT